MRLVALSSCLAVLSLAACGSGSSSAGEATPRPEPVVVTATGEQRTEDVMVTLTITKHREGAPDEVVTTTAPADEAASLASSTTTSTTSSTTTPAETTSEETVAPAEVTTTATPSSSSSSEAPTGAGPGYAASNGFQAGTAGSLRAADPLAGSVLLPTSGAAAFVSPSGNLACTLDGTAVLCQVRLRDFTVPASDTEAAGCDANVRATTGSARFVCGDGDLGAEASLTGGKVSWWQSSLGAQDRGSAGDAYRAAVLPYGHALVVGGTKCRLDYEGVSCWAGASAFFLRKQTYLLQP